VGGAREDGEAAPLRPRQPDREIPLPSLGEPGSLSALVEEREDAQEGPAHRGLQGESRGSPGPPGSLGPPGSPVIVASSSSRSETTPGP